jgi:hypothetical protein
MCEGGLQFQFLQSSGDLFHQYRMAESVGGTYIKVLSKLNVSLSSKVDFSQDGIGSFGRRLVTHVLHGIDQVVPSDSGIVVLQISISSV